MIESGGEAAKRRVEELEVSGRRGVQTPKKIQEEQEIIEDNKGMAGPYMRNGWDDAAE